MPLAFGKAAEYLGDMQMAYSVGILSYLFILFYALKGHKIGSWS
jgi:fucose permease